MPTRQKRWGYLIEPTLDPAAAAISYHENNSADHRHLKHERKFRRRAWIAAALKPRANTALASVRFTVASIANCVVTTMSKAGHLFDNESSKEECILSGAWLGSQTSIAPRPGSKIQKTAMQIASTNGMTP
jgi:hypothetical protein